MRERKTYIQGPEAMCKQNIRENSGSGYTSWKRKELKDKVKWKAIIKISGARNWVERREKRRRKIKPKKVKSKNLYQRFRLLGGCLHFCPTVQ
jgi:hypothetical protein